MPSDSSVENISPKPFSRLWPRLILAAILLLVTGIRLRVASSPLERDEGEYAFIGQLMLQGIPPYTEAANMKFPGTYAAYAVIEAVFGQTSKGIHHGLLVMNLATILLMYHLGKVFLVHRHTAVMAAAIYAVSSLSYSFFGAMAHATHFVVFFGLAGLALLLSALKGKSPASFILAGFVIGLAYLAKQSGFYFVPFGCLLIWSGNDWRLFSRPTLRGLAYFIAGAFAPFALTVFILQQLGCLDNFVLWTLRYASTYGPPLKSAPQMLFAHLRFILAIGSGWIFFIPCILFFFPLVRRVPRLSRHSGIVLPVLFFLSLASVSLGLSFRNHYWIQALPAVALMSAQFYSGFGNWLHRQDPHRSRMTASLLCLACCSAVLIRETPRFFRTDTDQIIREIYRGEPFVQSVAIADYIQKHTNPNDRIFVFGNEPQIYFYAGRHSASSFIYLYSLLEVHRYTVDMTLTMVAEVESNRPRYFIEANLGATPQIEDKTFLFRWKTAYLEQNYHPLFLIDANSSDNEVIFIDASVYAAENGRFITIWERNS